MQNTSTEELHELFKACGQKISTDTRKPEAGALFFALRGANFDAHAFVQHALDSGCKYAVIDQASAHIEGRTFMVDDVLKALQDLALFHRKQFDIPVLAITGSNGKTSTKELVNAVLSQKFSTLCTEGNLNNHLGVPFTLLKLRPEHQIAVIEMGANHQGEIAALCRIADPGFGLITNIGKAHLEGFGGIEGVKKGKGELYDYLRSHNGIAFVNGDDEVLSNMSASMNRVRYGALVENDIKGEDCTTGETVDLKFGEGEDRSRWKTAHTKMFGRYNFPNCMAAVALGTYFKVPAEKIVFALETYEPKMNRSQVMKTEKNLLILDAYNANPNSMKVAIDNFSKYPSDNKLMLLGDMFELGESSAAEHQQVADIAEKSAIDTILVGDHFNRVHTKFKKFTTTEECLDHLKKNSIKGRTVLIKGSRGMKMEKLQEAL